MSYFSVVGEFDLTMPIIIQAQDKKEVMNIIQMMNVLDNCFQVEYIPHLDDGDLVWFLNKNNKIDCFIQGE